jgi:hypothetical protein
LNPFSKKDAMIDETDIELDPVPAVLT